MNPPPVPTCGPGDPVLGCCSVAIPNTSEWQVVCASPSGGPPSVPSLLPWAGTLLAALLIVAALRRLR
jgi:hypothetical protein